MEGKIGKYCHHEDAELLNLYPKSKDKEIIDEIYQRYRHLVYGLAFKNLKNKDETEDVAMEVWTVVIQDLPKGKIQNLRAWLYITVKNRCMNFSRKKERELQKFAAFSEEMERKHATFVENDSLNSLINDAAPISQQDLAKAIKKLPSQQRECIRKFYHENLNYKDVSLSTGFKVQQVKSFLQNGKRNLKMILTKKLSSHE